MKKGKFSLFLFFAIFIFFAHSKDDQGENFEIKIEPKESNGQAITISLEVNSNSDILPDIQLQTIEDYKNNWDISGPQKLQKTQVVLVNGKKTQRSSVMMRFLATPLKTGQLKTPKIKILVSNKPLEIKETLINVKNLTKSKSLQAQQPSSPSFPFFNMFDFDEEKKLQELEPEKNNTKQLEVLVVAEPSKTEVFEGELITLPFYIYTNENIFRNLEFGSFPTFKDFLKEQLYIPKNWRPERAEYRNSNYFKAEVIRFALFPIRTGDLLIDPLKMRFEVDTDIFQLLEQMKNSQQILGQNQTFNKTSGSIPIKVIPLPPKPATISQKSIPVGNFKISMQSADQKILQNEAFNLKIRIEGKGNIKGLEEPELKLPPALQKSRTSTNYETNDQSEGYKDFEMLIVPQEAGDYKLTDNSWSYFDPDKKIYQTLIIPPIELHVESSNKNFSLEGKKEKSLVFNGVQEFVSLEESSLPKVLWAIPLSLYGLASMFFLQRRRREKEDLLRSNFPWLFIENKIYSQKDINSNKTLAYIEEWILLRFSKLLENETSFDELMEKLLSISHDSINPKIKKLSGLFKKLEERRFGTSRSLADKSISFEEIKKLSEEIIQSSELSSSLKSEPELSDED